MGALKRYAPRDNKYVGAKNNLLNNAKNFYEGREKIIEGFKNGVFPVCYDERHENQMKAEREIEEDDEEEFLKYIEDESKDIGYILFSYYFNFAKSIDMTKKLFEIKDKKKNDDFVKEIKNRWSKLKDSIEKTPRDEEDNKKIEKILKTVKDILKFNEQYQQVEGIKILTPNQMLNRSPIALAQLQAGNNSNKLKNKIRQLLYSLYRSKDISEQVYKSLIGII